jgi:hypothetical protein
LPEGPKATCANPFSVAQSCLCSGVREALGGIQQHRHGLALLFGRHQSDIDIELKIRILILHVYRRRQRGARRANV